MIFRQLTHDDLGCASYLIGDEDAGVAAVVDPRLRHRRVPAARPLPRACASSTCSRPTTHADHVSGHGRLAAATGATIHIHREAGAEYPHEPFDDGWELVLGVLAIRALHTPGHRPEHTAFALIDTARGRASRGRCSSGDTLFVGDIARPDLAVDKPEGARGIFRSLHDRLLALPDTCEVWPGHLGGSMCGGPGMDLKVASTIGFERAHQELLAIDDEDEFVARAIASLGPQPPNFQAIVALNRGPLLTRRRRARMPLTPRQVEQPRADGALLVDVRTELQFDEAHIPGAVCIPTLRAGFGSKLAWLAEPRAADSCSSAATTRTPARRPSSPPRSGCSTIGGYLAGGMTAGARSGARRRARDAHRPCPSCTSAATSCRCSTSASAASGRRATSRARCTCPTTTSTASPTGIDPARPVAVICASGQRAAVGASLLQRAGAREVVHVVDGGVGRWKR